MKKEIQKINNIEQIQKVHLITRHSITRKIIELICLITIIGAGTASAYASSISPDNLLEQINYQREIRGLTQLKIDSRLMAAAEKKSEDMIENDYFEHYANGLSPWSFIKDENYDYLYAGENLAMDFQTSEGMVRAWMSSPTHRKNILNPDFNETGFGVVKGEYTDNNGTHETVMVTNMFGREKPKILQFFDSVVARIKNIF